MEIERKFLVSQSPALDVQGIEIEQGYLDVSDESEVRVRRAGPNCLLTAKGGHGLARTETEVPISDEAFQALWPATEGRRLEKTRYRIPLSPGLWAEVDHYRGDLQGLRVVEVEFSSEAEARAFDPPSWFGQELTGDLAWSNARLAVDGAPF